MEAKVLLLPSLPVRFVVVEVKQRSVDGRGGLIVLSVSRVKLGL